MIVSSAKFCLESKRNTDAQIVEFRINEQVVLSSVSRFGVQRRVTGFNARTRPRVFYLTSRVVLDGTSCPRLCQ